jgi:integrase
MQSKYSASIKVKLRTNRTNTQKEHPIIIRVTKDCKSSILSIGYNVRKEEWDEKDKEVKKHHKEQLKINKEIRDIKAKLSELMTAYKDKKVDYSSSELINAYLNNSNSKQLTEEIEKRTEEVGLFEYYRLLDKRMLSNKQFKTRETYIAAMGWVEKFLKNENFQEEIEMPISTLDYVFLLDLLTFIRSKKPNIKGATLFGYFKNYKAIKNKAKREGKCSSEKCDLHKFSLAQFDTGTAPRYISLDDIKKIESVKLPKESGLWHARNYFLFSFYSLGMNLLDIATLEWSNIIEASTRYKRKKTGNNFDFQTNAKCLAIIKEYKKSHKSALVFPILKNTDLNDIDNYEKYKNKQKIINQNLRKVATKAGVNSRITFYTARHSFASGCKEMGCSTEYISEFLGHSNVEVTMKYLRRFSDAEKNKVAEQFYASMLT